MGEKVNPRAAGAVARARSERDALVADILTEHPPVERLEELMGPGPSADDPDDLEAFLEARTGWQQPYSPASEDR